METVITLSGLEVPKDSCVNIDDYYYIKEKEAVQIDYEWYPIHSPLIYYNLIENRYLCKNRDTIYGIVDWDTQDNKPVHGFFQQNALTRNVIIGSNKVYIPNADILNKIQFTPNKTLGVNSLGSFSKMQKYLSSCIGIKNLIYSFGEHYSSSELLPKFLEDSHQTVINTIPDSAINQEHIKAWPGYSIGIEFETSNGNLFEEDCHNYGLIPLRDGSINGHEYVTIPLQGSIEGFKLLKAQIQLLKDNCTFDKNCSLHIHLGNFPIQHEIIYALYKLCVGVESDIASLFCYNCFDTHVFKTSGKNYCTRLPKEFGSFKTFYRFLSGDRLEYDGTLTYAHPLDQRERSKWNMKSRYLWANFINLCFKTHGKTMEFRVHESTFNQEKIINWLFICAALLKYTELNYLKINKIPISRCYFNLKDILKEVYPNEISSQLITYCKYREEFFKESTSIYNDRNGYYNLQLDPVISYDTHLIYNEQ